MNLKAQRAAALKAAQDIINGAKSAMRDLTSDEQATVEAKFAEIEDLDGKIADAEKSGALMRRIEGFGGGAEIQDETPAKSIGEHFAKSLQGRSIKSLQRFETPEFKAATDTQAVGSSGGAFGPLVTDIDRSFVMPYRQRLVVADLFGAPGTLSGNAIQYPIFPAAIEGGAGMVSEGGQKPQLHIPDPTWVTDALSEVAGYFKVTDDMAEDIPYVVSEIEGTARYDLLFKEEQQLLSGNGAAPNLRGLLNRSGVQTAAKGTDSVADAIFKTFKLVSNATPFQVDGIVINDSDYEALRLTKDGNGQYMGGGFFAGQYGAGGILEQPPIWGKRTVVTAAIPAGTVLVGAFAGSSKVFRKGGLRVESTNSHADDFTNDKITIRLRERLGLQVKYPAAYVALSLA